MKLTPKEFAEWTDNEDGLEQATKLKCTGRNITSVRVMDSIGHSDSIWGEFVIFSISWVHAHVS